jgi:predicted nucleotidyltransferase component of viral defense system
VIKSAELLQLAANLGLTPAVVEKDYVLGWLLAGIRANAELADHWVFKGGTCLKKCYFETYRFSEDLDFTVINEAHIDAAFLLRVFADISAWVYDQTGLEIPAEQLRFDVFQNKRDKLACQGRIYYRGPIAPRGDLPRIKLDLTTDELLALPPVERPVVHSYSDAPAGGMSALCYAYEEVFGEKVRALGERARPRDLYDVINLYRHDEFQPAPASILDVLKRKCAHKSIGVPTLETIGAFREELAGDWATMLAHQLPALPPLNSFWDALPEFFAWLAGGARPAMPPSYPLARGEEILRQPLGMISGPGIVSSALESIRFAAANRLTVEIDYIKESGERTTREIEAYSLRRTAAGRIVLHAHDMHRNDHRSYRTDRILTARATGRIFTPRLAIELTPGGPQAIPQATRAASYANPWGAPQSGPAFVFQCPVCSKTFRRKTRDDALRPHKTPDGWNCSGRRAVLIDTTVY